MEEKIIVGYKGFRKDWTSHSGFQFTVGNVYKHTGNHDHGIDFCVIPLITLFQYDREGCKYALIHAYGEILYDKYGETCTARKIKIIKEMSEQQIREATDGKYEINGNTYYYKKGERHSKDGPAVSTFDGDKEWRINDILHRTDGPAMIYSDGEKEWWENGKLCKSEVLPKI